MAAQARAVRVGEHACSMVVVTEGDGLARTFRSLGADVVPEGERASVESIVAAIEGAPADEAVVLTNGDVAASAARDAASRSRKSVRLVPARSIPAGLSAAAAFNPAAAAEDNVAQMREAAAASRAG